MTDETDDLADDLAVVVITRNRRDELLRTLGRLTGLPERPAVVIVDNGSDDGTAQAVRAEFGANPRIRLLEPGRNLGAAGRNVAVAALPPNVRYVAFCDDDTWWEPGALRLAAQLLGRHPTVAVLTARIVVEPGGREDPINTELRHSPLPTPDTLPGPRLGSFLAGASVVRRAAFEAAGGFSELIFLGGEEELLAADLLTAGWDICHVPELCLHHQPSAARDPDRRRRHGVRNALWFWWLRRPAGAALRRTAALLRSAPKDRVTAAGVFDALRGAGPVLRQRRVVPPRVEAYYRLLDAPQTSSKARRYVS